jgi:hypothetical protein
MMSAAKVPKELSQFFGQKLSNFNLFGWFNFDNREWSHKICFEHWENSLPRFV